MDDNEDETNFSDDGLDALPDNALFELEQNAFQSTQHPYVPHKQLSQTGRYDGRPSRAFVPRQLQGGYEHHNGEHFDDTEVLDDAGIATPVEEKEAFIPARTSGQMTQREQWRQARFGRPQPQGLHEQALRSNLGSSGYVDQGHDIEMQDALLSEVQPTSRAHVGLSDQAEAFQAQIADLLKERDKLTRDLHEKESAVMTQRGEISIIRANQSKEAQAYQRELTALKKSNQEEVAKYKAAIDAANEENRRTISARQFEQRELEEEVRRNKILEKTLKEKPQAEHADGMSTPKKTRVRPLGDGFDDGEIMVVSPVKSGRTSKSGTPTAGGKRKRKADNTSPMPPLVLRPSAPEPRKETSTAPKPERIPPIIRRDRAAEHNLRFMQKILNHSIPGSQERLIEKFTQFTFPSEKARPFSTTVLQATAALSGESFRSDLLQIFVSLWSRALKEKFYAPIPLFVDLVQFVIALDSSVINLKIVTSLLPVLQTSAEINGIIRFNNAKATPVVHQNFIQPKQKPKVEVNSDVDSTECLETLYSVACACLQDEEKIDRFWRSMSTDFVLLFLNSSQPIRDLVLVLNVLSTSILPTTFGNICGTEDDQAKAEKYIIDRVTYLLWEIPRADQGQKPYTRPEISELRIEAMALLTILGLSSPHPHDNPDHHGSRLLADHPNAIGRLVRCMYEELDALYAHGPGFEMHALLVNEATRLVYRLLQLHGESINMQHKLLAINGGVHKHRVVLCRLAFSEGLYLDQEIDDETVVMARDMLEEAVTPEEGEALLEVFPKHRERTVATQE